MQRNAQVQRNARVQRNAQLQRNARVQRNAPSAHLTSCSARSTVPPAATHREHSKSSRRYEPASINVVAVCLSGDTAFCSRELATHSRGGARHNRVDEMSPQSIGDSPGRTSDADVERIREPRGGHLAPIGGGRAPL